MKCLYISADTYPPFRVDVEVLFGKKMREIGCQNLFILQSKDKCKKSYKTKWLGNIVIVGKNYIGKKPFQKFINQTYGLINDIRAIPYLHKNDIDFIILKDKFISAALFSVLSKKFKKPLIYWLSYPYPEANIHKAKNNKYFLFYYLRGRVYAFLLYKIILKLCVYAFVQSEQMKKDIVTKGIDSAKLSAVPMGVELENDDFKIKNDYLKNSNAYPKILYLGTMVKVRKIDFVLRVFKKVIKIIPNAMLYMVGGSEIDEDLEYLKNYAKKLNIDKSILFTGLINRKEALNYVKEADVCLSPFYPTPILNSTSPTKIIEYMALKKPIVGNDHPEQKKIIKEANCGICVHYNEKEFANAIIKIIESPQESIVMGINGRKYIEKHRDYKIIAQEVKKKLIQIKKHCNSI